MSSIQTSISAAPVKSRFTSLEKLPERIVLPEKLAPEKSEAGSVLYHAGFSAAKLLIEEPEKFADRNALSDTVNPVIVEPLKSALLKVHPLILTEDSEDPLKLAPVKSRSYQLP